MTTQPSPAFFSLLPREIRDEVNLPPPPKTLPLTNKQIYSHLLVQDSEIFVNSGITHRQNFREIATSQQPGHDGTGNYPPLDAVHPLAVPVRKRSTWKVPLKRLAPWNKLSHAYSDEGEFVGAVDAAEVMVEMTYQVAHVHKGRDQHEERTGSSVGIQGLQCLLACQQMYDEARKTFYAKNKFTAADHTAFMHFLQDRPEACQSSLRSVGMHFDERAWDGSFETGTTSYCDDFESLCRILSGPPLSLREFQITVYNTFVEPSWTARVAVASCLRADKGDPKPPFYKKVIRREGRPSGLTST